MEKILLKDKNLIFIDFDGTIKNSDNVKAKAFIKIFGNKINATTKNKIKNHHYRNLGVSRFNKIPIYLNWNGLLDTKKNIYKYNKKFSKVTIKEVCLSKWIPGAKKFITSNKDKKLILITATPKKEIKIILKKLNIYDYFYKIYGSPIIKSEVVREVLNKIKIEKNKCLYIGNSLSDYYAAKKNLITYINIGKIKNFKKKYNFIKNFNLIDQSI